MFEHRLALSNQVTVTPFVRPFSSFYHVDNSYHINEQEDNPAIRRLFSLARSHGARTLITEEIQPAGIILDENNEIKQYYNDYQMAGLRRISFWKTSFNAQDAGILQEKDCVGYAILKRDQCPSQGIDKWHIFEALFKKYEDKHNCVPSPGDYQVTLATKRFNLKGLLFAQQNGLNKSCAQVALRSVISRIRPEEISYREINELVQQASPGQFNPGKGLRATQIRAVLEGLNIPFRDFDYEQGKPDDRKRYPYQKFVYSGVESGVGALLGFRLSGPAISAELRHRLGHIIPFYGHTFNKDTWAPEADKSYFKVGERVAYIPSENWTSSFIGHDDNFGPNFCIPRLYINSRRVDYVVELLKPGAVFGGSQAEILSLQFLYSVLNVLKKYDFLQKNIWLNRLAFYASRSVRRIVLRAIAIERDQYIHHLSNETDWQYHKEDNRIIDELKQFLPRYLWIVEVSIPELFPANERKPGDIVLSSNIKIGRDPKDRRNFVLVRLPSLYLFYLSSTPRNPKFLYYPSTLESHFPVIHLD